MPVESLISQGLGAIEQQKSPFDELAQGTQVGAKLAQVHQEIESNKQMMQIKQQALDDGWDEKMMAAVPKIFNKAASPQERKIYWGLYNQMADQRGKPRMSEELLKLGISNEDMTDAFASVMQGILKQTNPAMRRAMFRDTANRLGVSPADIPKMSDEMFGGQEKLQVAIAGNESKAAVAEQNNALKLVSSATAKGGAFSVQDAAKMIKGISPGISDADALARAQVFVEGNQQKKEVSDRTGMYQAMRLKLSKDRLASGILKTASGQMVRLDQLDERIRNGLLILNKPDVPQKMFNEAALDLATTIKRSGIATDSQLKSLGFESIATQLEGYASRITGDVSSQTASPEAVSMFRDMFTRLGEMQKVARDNVASKNIDAQAAIGAFPAEYAETAKAWLADPAAQKEKMSMAHSGGTIMFNNVTKSVANWRKALMINPATGMARTPDEIKTLKEKFKAATGKDL